jgi:uncharacterized protein (TIGR03437 family)
LGTGEGQTTPAGVDGQVASSVFPKPVLPVSVTIGGVSLAASDILYFGVAPSFADGVLQINLHIPTSVASGPQPVVVTVGSASSQAGLTVAVR